MNKKATAECVKKAENSNNADMKRNTRASMEACNIADIASIVAEFPEGDEEPKKFPIKKLQMSFDDLAKQPSNSENNNSMRVSVRVRPLEKGKEGTIRIASDSEIVTTAPEASRRAQYTKTEERHYVSLCHTVSSFILSFIRLFILFLDQKKVKQRSLTRSCCHLLTSS
jgi:hypothetical protein